MKNKPEFSQKQLDKFYSLFEKDEDMKYSEEQKTKFAHFFEEVTRSFIKVTSAELLVDLLTSNNHMMVDIQSYILASYITGIESYRKAVMNAYPDVAEYFFLFDREYIFEDTTGE